MTFINDMKVFCDSYNITSLSKQPTCYTPRSFQNTCVIEARLSDFNLMISTVVKNSNPDLSIIGCTKTSQMKPLGSVY